MWIPAKTETTLNQTSVDRTAFNNEQNTYSPEMKNTKQFEQEKD